MTGGRLLAGGTLVDGTGAAPRPADLLLRDGVVELLPPGSRAGDGSIEIVSCAGLVVAPGFVDIHTHSDLTRLRYPDAASRVLQGVTTEVIGNCGLTAAPVPDPAALAEFRSVIGPIDVAPDVAIDWRSAAEILERLDAHRGATNLVPLIGHGSLRYAASGLGTAPAGENEMATILRELDEALDAGYWGMSLGLMYAPGEASGRGELSAAARRLATRPGALLSAHLRAYDGLSLPGALAEVLALAEESGVPLEVSHLRSIADPDGRGLDEAMELLEGSTHDVEADAYPYLAGHTTLLQLLPEDLRARGVSVIAAMAVDEPGAVAGAFRRARRFDPSAILVVKAGPTPADEVGRTLADLAQGGDWADAAEDLVRRHDGNVDVIVEGTRPEDALRVLRHPLVSVASDGVALDLDHTANRPHPRSVGTFPRAFRELADSGMPMEAIVHKMTGKPARRLGLDRGELRAGAVADVVVFDPDAMRDNASYLDPLVPPSGVRDVYVGGRAVLEAGVATGARPAGVLRRRS